MDKQTDEKNRLTDEETDQILKSSNKICRMYPDYVCASYIVCINILLTYLKIPVSIIHVFTNSVVQHPQHGI